MKLHRFNLPGAEGILDRRNPAKPDRAQDGWLALTGRFGRLAEGVRHGVTTGYVAFQT